MNSWLENLFTFGPAYKATVDEPRLTTQRDRIRDYMLAGSGWYTLAEIEAYTGYPQASISAQIRHLVRLEGVVKQKRRRVNGCGTWEYRLTNGEGQK